MDYMKFVDYHRSTGADVTVGCLPCDAERATEFGLMKIDKDNRVVSFAEKPKGDALEAMRVDTTSLGLAPEDAKNRPFIASMGIYVFKKSALIELLNKRHPKANDFGGEIIPAAARDYNVKAYLFDDYWEDIGTIRSFFEENLKLARHNAPFEFYDPASPIYTSPRFLPPAKVENCRVTEAIISHGALVRDSIIDHAVVGLRSQVERGCTIRSSLLIGADFYESEEERALIKAKGGVPMGIGAGSTIENCIIDKNARVGPNCRLTNAAGVQEASREEDGYVIRSGIIVVCRNATIAPGTVI
jgi:glucose-1-phosphate adenylyltransferase